MTTTDQSNLAKLVNKVNTLIIPKIDLNNVTIEEALQFLTQESKRTDPDHQGVNFVLALPASTTRITLKLENAPLKDALNSIGGQAHLFYSVEEFAVYLKPPSFSEEMAVRTFVVPDGFASFLQLKPGTSGRRKSGFCESGNQVSSWSYRYLSAREEEPRRQEYL